jgi:hypothetical protein
MEGKVMQQDLVKANSDKLVTGQLVKERGAPLLARFLGKFVLDIMPAALASVIGGFLFTQFHFGLSQPKPVLEQVTPASAEMMALVRDEHAMIVDYLKTQMAAERSRVAVEDAALARAQEDSKMAEAKAADAKTADAKTAEAKTADAKTAEAKTADAKPVIVSVIDAAPRRGAVSAAAAKPIVWRAKPSAVAAVPLPTPAPRAPMVIAQADPGQDAPQSDRLASDPNSLLGRALDVKDHVVAGARHAVSAIGDMFAAVGGALNPQASLPRQFTEN